METLLARINRIQQESEQSFGDAQRGLCILYKYRVLRAYRTRRLQEFDSSYSPHQQAATVFTRFSRPKLIALKTWDDAMRHHIYGQDIPILEEAHRDKLASVLTLEAQQMLLRVPTTEAFLETLAQGAQHFLRQNLSWQQQLEEEIEKKNSRLTWREWFKEKIGAIAETISQFSLLNWAGELGQLAGDACQSPQWGRRLGQGFGLGMSYYLGTYNFVRTVLIGRAVTKIRETYRRSHTHDQTASVISSPLLNLLSVPGNLNTLASIFESLYSRSIYPFLRSLFGNQTGNISVKILRSHLHPSHSNQDDLYEKVRVVLLVPITFLVGSQLGVWLASLIENAFTNYTIHRTFEALIRDHLRSSGGELLNMEPPALGSLSFWFSRGQTTCVRFQTSDPIFLERTCILQQTDLRVKAVEAACEESRVSFLALPF